MASRGVIPTIVSVRGVIALVVLLPCAITTGVVRSDRFSCLHELPKQRSVTWTSSPGLLEKVWFVVALFIMLGSASALSGDPTGFPTLVRIEFWVSTNNVHAWPPIPA